jgi:hypothetical protein
MLAGLGFAATLSNVIRRKHCSLQELVMTSARADLVNRFFETANSRANSRRSTRSGPIRANCDLALLSRREVPSTGRPYGSGSRVPERIEASEHLNGVTVGDAREFSWLNSRSIDCDIWHCLLVRNAVPATSSSNRLVNRSQDRNTLPGGSSPRLFLARLVIANDSCSP